MARPRPSLEKPILLPRTTGALPTHDVDGRPFVRLQTLGAVSLLVGTVRIGATAGMQFSLLLRVASATGCQLSRRAVIDALWPDLDDTHQRGNLRQALYKLRGLGVAIALDGGIVALDPTQLLRTFSTERSADLFARDVTHGHEPFGPFLPGFSAPWPAFQEWLDGYRDAVHADVRRVLSAQLRQRRERADWGGAEALARWLLQFDPLNEEGTLTVAECAALSGSKTEALAILDRYLAELGPDAGDIRLPASMLRRRIAEPVARTRLSFAPTERHFIGRGDELAELTLAMRRARWNDGSAMLWHGAPGIGKSRLAYELTKVAMLEGVRVLSAPCRESDVLRPLSVFIDLVPDLLSQPGALGCSPDTLSVLRRLVPLDRRDGLPGATTEADRATHATVEGDDLPYREPMPTLAVLRSALIDLLAAVSHEKPTLLVVDDAHWIDESSWDVLADLIDRVGALRVCVVLMSREPHARMVRPQRVPLVLRVHALAPLSAESCLALSRAIGSDLSATIDDALGAWFVRASEGNPLFLRALVNHWIETGEAGGVPPTLHGVIEQRLSQLSGDALRVLQTAALLGKWATVERVGRVLEVTTLTILTLICELESADVLSKEVPHVVKCHDLVAYTCGSSFRQLSGSVVHSRIAALLEDDYVRSADPALFLAILSHWRSAQRPSEALRFASHYIESIEAAAEPNALLAVLTDLDVSNFSESARNAYLAVVARARVGCGQYSAELLSFDGIEDLPTANELISHHEAERGLSWVDSSYRSDTRVDHNKLAQYAEELSVLDHLPREIRTRAAAIATVIFSNQGNFEGIDRIWESIKLTEVEMLELPSAPAVALMFHTLRGSRERAREMAFRMLSGSNGSSCTSADVAQNLRAGFALRVVSDDHSHLDAFEVAFQIGSRLGLYLPAVTAAWQLAQCALEREDAAESKRWLSALREIHSKSPDAMATSFADALYCRMAIERGERAQARELLSVFRSKLPVSPSVKAVSHGLVLETAIDLLDSTYLVTEDRLTLLLSYCETVGRLGTSDYLARVTLEALLRSSSSKAAEFARRYVAVLRRDQSPLPPRLSTLVDQLLATDSVAPANFA
ncbi:MAG: AAA family ATPase [Gemmatimonadaceae bacterium]|nr:AAA family ATPase [Gemmatimonadaceae bacterium]